MPYIKQTDRTKLDPQIDALGLRICEIMKDSQSNETASAGLLNYAITRTVLYVIKNQFGGVRYWVIALMSGMLHNVADEFYRRLASPYENKQIINNGDVDLYEELNK